MRAPAAIKITALCATPPTKQNKTQKRRSRGHRAARVSADKVTADPSGLQGTHQGKGAGLSHRRSDKLLMMRGGDK